MGSSAEIDAERLGGEMLRIVPNLHAFSMNKVHFGKSSLLALHEILKIQKFVKCLNTLSGGSSFENADCH